MPAELHGAARQGMVPPSGHNPSRGGFAEARRGHGHRKPRRQRALQSAEHEQAFAYEPAQNPAAGSTSYSGRGRGAGKKRSGSSRQEPQGSYRGGQHAARQADSYHSLAPPAHSSGAAAVAGGEAANPFLIRGWYTNAQLDLGEVAAQLREGHGLTEQQFAVAASLVAELSAVTVREVKPMAELVLSHIGCSAAVELQSQHT